MSVKWLIRQAGTLTRYVEYSSFADEDKRNDQKYVQTLAKPLESDSRCVPFITHTSQHRQVKTAVDGINTMLEITFDKDELIYHALMNRWERNGTYPFIAHESLSSTPRDGRRIEACSLYFLQIIIFIHFNKRMFFIRICNRCQVNPIF